jgi:hypothetical protein
MAWEGPSIKVPNLKAGEDLRTYQYCFVTLSATGTVSHCSGITIRPIGILQNNPNTGEEAEVTIFGITKVKANEVLAVGDSIVVGAVSSPLGQANKGGTGATTPNVGTVLLGGAAHSTITATINCMNQER